MSTEFEWPLAGEKEVWQWPVITYSYISRDNVYQKFGKWKTFWRWLTNADPIYIGHHIKADIVICAEAYKYFRIMDIVQIRQIRWLISDKPENGILRVRTLEPTRQIHPIHLHYLVYKLYSTIAEP